MTYTVIHIIHLFAAFTYGGFLIVDYLFLSKMKQTLSEDEHKKARESFMIHVRKVVPNALFVAVLTGLYLAHKAFGEIGEDGLSNFQILLLIKATLGLWLGIRGFNQVVLKINPLVFKSHTLPFFLVITIILLSQLMFVF